ncbi:MAG: hypothetical protein HOM11_03975 [Methylococcales bacterium]|nr:hypothetical protein [Methylococcales bacterium]
MFALTEDVDCQLILTIKGNQVYDRIIIARYAYKLDFDYINREIAFSATHEGVNISLDDIQNTHLEARSLINPIEKSKKLFPIISEGTPMGAWQIPGKLNPGPWLIIPDNTESTSVRPGLFIEQGETLCREGSLACAISSDGNRIYLIEQCIQMMADDYQHKDWHFVFEFLAAFQHLPAAALDLWKCFASNPYGLTAMLFKADDDMHSAVLDLVSDLPVLWEMIPFAAWHNAAENWVSYINATAPNEEIGKMLLISTLQQRFERMKEASGLLEIYSRILSSEFLSIDDEELNRSKLFNEAIVFSILSGLSDRLKGRHVADEKWTYFRELNFVSIIGTLPPNLSPLFLQQSRDMDTVLQAPIAMALNNIPRFEGKIRLNKETVYKFRMLKDFDSEWFTDAFVFTTSYLYGQKLMNKDVTE